MFCFVCLLFFSGDMLDEVTAIVDGYNAYFSFSKVKTGYSGETINNFWMRVSMIARIIKAEVLPKPKAEGDNTNQGLDNFAIMRKPNPIIMF